MSLNNLQDFQLKNTAIPQELCHGCMQGKHSKASYHTYANKICNPHVGTVHSCMAILLVKSPYLPLVDHNILFCIKMIHLVTGLFYAHARRMLPSFSFRKWSRLFAMTKALRCRNYALIRVKNISTKASLLFWNNMGYTEDYLPPMHPSKTVFSSATIRQSWNLLGVCFMFFLFLHIFGRKLSIVWYTSST